MSKNIKVLSGNFPFHRKKKLTILNAEDFDSLIHKIK